MVARLVVSFVLKVCSCMSILLSQLKMATYINWNILLRTKVERNHNIETKTYKKK